MTFTPYRDHIILKVDADAAHRTASGLHLPDWQRGDRDPEYGTVLAAPLTLSPNATLDFAGLDGNTYYYPDLVDLPKAGDTVYIKYNSLLPHLEDPDQPGVYIVALDRVVAIKDAHGLRPFQGYVLGQPVWGDDVRVNAQGQLVRVKVSPGRKVHLEDDVTISYDSNLFFEGDGIVVETDPLPEPFLLHITHAGKPLRGQPDVAAVGDVVVGNTKLYAYHAVKQADDDPSEGQGRWMWQAPSINIDGRDYHFLPRQAIMGKRYE